MPKIFVNWKYNLFAFYYNLYYNSQRFTYNGDKMKKLSALLICLLMIVTCALAGCSTFSIDKVRYYNEVVATVGEEKITRFDLLNAYSSYGQSYYVSQLGQSEQEAFKSTLELLTKRESLYQWAKENVTLTEYEVNSAVESMFDSIDKQMESYVATAKTIFNITSTVTPTEETTETAYKFDDYKYTPRAEIVEENKIKYIVDDKEYTAVIDEAYLSEPFKDGVINEVKTKYLAHFQNSLVNEEQKENLYNKAISFLADDLINYEYYLRDTNNKPYNTVTNDLLFRYFERNYNSQIKGAYLTKIRSEYLKNATETGEVNVTKLIETYTDLYTASKETYLNNPEQYKTDVVNPSNSVDDMLYHPEFTDGTEFGYFVHTLISFDKEGTQKKALDEAKIKYENSTDQDREETYKTERNEILSLMTAQKRSLETGLIEGTSTMAEVLAEYRAISSLEDFIKFMFKYSTDDATLKARMPYVIGYNRTYDGETMENNSYVGAYSNMVAEFTKEALDIMKNGRTMSTKLKDVDADQMCVSTYGIHFVYYVSKVDLTNYPDATDILSKKVNPLTGETYFEKLFDYVYPTDSNEEVYASVDGYDDYEESLIDNSKIEIYETKLNGTKSRI